MAAVKGEPHDLGRAAVGLLPRRFGALPHGFVEAWNSEPFVKLRAAHLKKDVTGTVCEKCVAYQ
jgi:hypothetical protein